jgi:hypothetical protein
LGWAGANIGFMPFPAHLLGSTGGDSASGSDSGEIIRNPSLKSDRDRRRLLTALQAIIRTIVDEADLGRL